MSQSDFISSLSGLARTKDHLESIEREVEVRVDEAIQKWADSVADKIQSRIASAVKAGGFVFSNGKRIVESIYEIKPYQIHMDCSWIKELESRGAKCFLTNKSVHYTGVYGEKAPDGYLSSDFDEDSYYIVPNFFWKKGPTKNFSRNVLLALSGFVTCGITWLWFIDDDREQEWKGEAELDSTTKKFCQALSKKLREVGITNFEWQCKEKENKKGITHQSIDPQQAISFRFTYSHDLGKEWIRSKFPLLSFRIRCSVEF